MLDNLSDIEEAIANHAASCGEKLRRQHSCASLITVFVATNPFRKDTPQYTNSISLMLPHPVNNAPELIHYAKHGLNIVFKKGYLYKKVGVIVQELTPESTLQTSLFRDTEQDEKKQKLMQTLDKLNRQFGKNTVKMAAQGTAEQRWKLRQEKCSPHYTTQFKDIFLVKAG